MQLASPLHLAAFNNRPDSIEVLIAHGAVVSAQTKTGWTALHFAASKGYCEVISKLLAAGAPVDASAEEVRCHIHCCHRITEP